MSLIETIRAFFKSIRFRLTLWYLLVIAVLLGCFGAAAYLILSYQLHRNLNESLRSRAGEIETGLKVESGQVTIPGQPTDLVLVYGSSGVLLRNLGPSISFSGVGRLVTNALLGQSGFATGVTPEGQKIALYASPYTILPDTRVAVVIGKPQTEIESVLSTVKSILWLSALVAILLAAVGGSILANRALYPVFTMTGAAENIGESNLSHRIDIHGEDELGRLASTLNRMIDRLETAFNRQRQFAADASHELRTPLSVIQAESSLALGKERTADEYRKSLEVVSQEVDYMTTMLGNLLSMARSEAGKDPYNFEQVNLKDLMKDLSPNVQLLAGEKGLKFKFGTLEDAVVEGDRVRLKQLFLNILDNAVRYTATGGSVSASLTTRDNQAVISISDTGIGIPSEQLELIFERFYRVDKARSRAQGGAGLGLAIAKYIVDNHGGRIEVESKVGHGSTFTIFLPLASAVQIASDSN